VRHAVRSVQGQLDLPSAAVLHQTALNNFKSVLLAVEQYHLQRECHIFP